MAGGKLTPRQKMINLMYLVFIAMLAMNMSKEVLSAFGLMNEKFESANKSSLATNEAMLAGLDAKAVEDQHYVEASKTGHQVQAASKKFYDFIGTLKAEVLKGVEVEKETGKLPYESMDKGDNIDNSWFTGEGYSKRGTQIITAIEEYKAAIKGALGSDTKYAAIEAEVAKKFDLADVKDKEGVKVKYLEYHFDKFPAIASLAKLTAWQNDVEKTESDVYNTLLGKVAVAASSMTNYTAIVVPEKSSFFAGEAVKGSVYLGRYDKQTVPTAVSVNGGSVKMVDGQAQFSIGAGNVGEHDINGKFTFMESGKPVSIPIKGNYVVVPKPNSATISADKMNVVYRGVANPITISFAGVSANNVSASAPGLSPAGKPGAYVMKPGNGTETTIVVTGKLADGTSVSDRKTFRIKNIPAPVGAIGGTAGSTKGAKTRLGVSEISAKLLDFDFDLKLRVTQFTFKVPGQAAVVVSGNRVNAQCVAAMARATRGDQVTITDIKTVVEGSPILLPQTAPAIYEIL